MLPPKIVSRCMKEVEEVYCNDSLKMPPRNRSKHAAKLAADREHLEELIQDVDQVEAELLLERRNRTEEKAITHKMLMEANNKVARVCEEQARNKMEAEMEQVKNTADRRIEVTELKAELEKKNLLE